MGKDQEAFWKEMDAEQEANCGVYFRNNVWWWRTLWQYCYEVCEHLLTYEEWQAGGYNDGHEYDEDVCIAMAELLQAEIDDGSCQRYQEWYQSKLDNTPNEPCSRCNGNNRGRKKKKDCNPCEGTGEQESWSKSYPFHVDNVQRFVKGKTTWGTISLTLFDPITPSGAQAVMEWVRLHHESVTGRDGYSDFYKKDLTLNVLGPVGDIVSEWVIKGALITEATFGDYNWDTVDTAQEVEFTVQPDYCVLNF